MKTAIQIVFVFLISQSIGLAAGNTIDQSTAQVQNANLNNNGSDNSMEAATNSAMRAVMNVAALNIPGAFYNGYKGYSEYTNSERMDDLELKNKYLRNTMRSNGSGGVTSVVAKKTTFSRLNKDFLYKGEMNDTASEFEKKSGMSREDFFKHLSSATDSDLDWDDPNLQQKLEQRFDMFTQSIPNKEFKDGLLKAANMFPDSARTKILGELFSKYQAAWEGTKPAETTVVDNSTAQPAPENPVAAATLPEVGSNQVAEVNRDPASLPAYQKNDLGLYIGIDNDNPRDALTDLLGANSNRDSLSIFQIVNKKYRALTPKMTSSSAL